MSNDTTILAILDRVAAFEADHKPDGYPAIRMADVSALRDEVLRRMAMMRRMVPVAEVPVHPRDGPLWANVRAIGAGTDLPRYRRTVLYAIDGEPT